MSPRFAAIEARCPAKVNLVLRVLGRRDDGFHEIDTVFQAIDWWDRVLAAPAAGTEIELSCDAPGVPADERNLVWRAAAALRERLPGTGGPGVRLRLEKRIPPQAGLGGGSSDAAGTLLVCARLWGIEPDPGMLAEVAAGLGSDVPFFLTGGTARGRGRGERIESLPSAGPLHLLVGLPPFGCSTRDVYAGVASRLTLPGDGVSVPLLSGHKWSEKNDFAVFGNDLEAVAFDLEPELRRFRDALVAEGAVRALLSGSGSAVFGVFDNGEASSAAASRLGASFPTWRHVVTRSVARGAYLVGASPSG